MTTLRALLASILALTALGAEARTLEEIRADGKIIVATEGAFPPFNFFKGPTLTGFEVEVAEALAKKMGVRIEWRALAFDALLAGLRQDRWDMVIASFAITDERSKAVSFTHPHYCSGGVIVSKSPAVRTVADLTGKIVAVQTGTTYLANVQKLGTAKDVKNFPKDTDARSALMTGRVDAWVTDRFVAKAAVEASAAAGLQIGDFVFVERIASAVKKGNASLETELNRALDAILADGTYAAISKKYLGEDVRCR